MDVVDRSRETPRWLRTDQVEQAADHGIGLHAIRVRLEIDEDAMAQDGQCDGRDVLVCDDAAILEERVRFRS